MTLLKKTDYDKGCFIKANLNILIEKIHISPLMPNYFRNSVNFLCKNELAYLEERIHQSILYQK